MNLSRLDPREDKWVQIYKYDCRRREELESGIRKRENTMEPYQMWISPPWIQRVSRAVKRLDNLIPKRQYGKY